MAVLWSNIVPVLVFFFVCLFVFNQLDTSWGHLGKGSYLVEKMALSDCPVSKSHVGPGLYKKVNFSSHKKKKIRHKEVW